MLRGLGGRCPACGVGALHDGKGRIARACAACGEELYHHRAGYPALLIAGLLAAHAGGISELALHEVIDFPPRAIAGMLLAALVFAALVRPIKGMMVGLQWAWRLFGFQYAAMCRPHRPVTSRADTVDTPEEPRRAA